MPAKRKILVTNALPYANGSLHLGHMVGYIQADIWVRMQKMLGSDCLYICGSDCHGTPIMIQAEKLGTTPDKMIEEISKEHEEDFKRFHIDFDNYYGTHSKENKELVEQIFKSHVKNDNIAKHTITQFYDPIKNIFLPDRYIKGECPRCHAKDQYGDNCEVCGATYQPTELINPFSTLSGTKPVEKDSLHYFFKLQNFSDFLKSWTHEGHLQKEVTNKLNEWFESGLREWDISRDAPYFGFKIPGEENKYFYVWLDAPVGYIASFKNLCEKRNNIDFDEYWKPGSQVELHHFIGKDIIYFHALFWPAVLQGAGFRTPTSIFANGFLTIDGQKMSKSRGTFIKARTYLNHLPAEFLRYYFSAKLTDNSEDLDLPFDDFTQRINSDLVGKFINIASRSAPFITKYFDGNLSSTLSEPQLFDEFNKTGDSIIQYFSKKQFSHGIRLIMQLADRANQFVDEKKPWSLIKDDKEKANVQQIATTALNLFRILSIYLKPVLPETVKQIEGFLNINSLSYQDKETPLLNHRISEYKPLIQRIDPKQIEAMKMAAETDIAQSTTPNQNNAETATQNENNYISIDEFNKLDLRIAKVLEADHIEGADKLLRLKVEVGTETRQIFAGIKSAYAPEQLVGKHVLIIANLAPRKMRFGISEGMLLVAGNGEGGIWLVSPEDGAPSGARVK